MNDTLLSIVAIVSTFGIALIVALAIVVGIDRYRNRSQLYLAAENAKSQIQRLRNPQFELVEKILNCKLPEPVVGLYQATEECMRNSFGIVPPNSSSTIYISHYCPCDPESLVDRYPACQNLLVIASDGGDISYAVDPKEDDPPVLSYDCETGELSIVADSVSSFMLWPRKFL